MTIDSIASSGVAGLAGNSRAGADSKSPAAASTAAAQRAPVPPTDAQLSKAVADLNKSSQDNAQGLEFSIDKDSKRTVVKVIDQATKEVLRQIPTAEALEIAKSIDQAQQGRLINQSA